MTPTSAMIFAAGFGTRMSPLTDTLPKPMVPLAGRPMIDHAIDLLRTAGISKIVANTHYLPDQIIPHLRAKDILVSDEQPDILDTGGGLKSALPLLGPGPVITINPDAVWFTANPVSQLLNDWSPEMTALLMLIENNRAFGTSNTGDFSLEHGKIRRNGDHIYGGAQIINTDRIGEITQPVFSLNAYWDHLARSQELNGTVFAGDWCDIGTPTGLGLAESMLTHV